MPAFWRYSAVLMGRRLCRLETRDPRLHRIARARGGHGRDPRHRGIHQHRRRFRVGELPAARPSLYKGPHNGTVNSGTSRMDRAVRGGWDPPLSNWTRFRSGCAWLAYAFDDDCFRRRSAFDEFGSAAPDQETAAILRYCRAGGCPIGLEAGPVGDLDFCDQIGRHARFPLLMLLGWQLKDVTWHRSLIAGRDSSPLDELFCAYVWCGAALTRSAFSPGSACAAP